VKLLKSLQFPNFGALSRTRGRALAAALTLLSSASCVPLQAAHAPLSIAHGAAPPIYIPTLPAAAAQAPEAEPMLLQPVSPTAAEAINAAIPLSTAPNPRAASIVLRAASVSDQIRSLQCLAEAVYYEARSESEDGRRAVAQVVLNRVRSPAYPGSVCGVVYQGPLRAGGGCQFTFTCDGSLRLSPAGPAWDSARRIAAAALSGAVYAPVGYATHYHTQEVVPTWAYRLVKAAVIGTHSFYRMQGAWGEPTAFDRRYAGREPSPGAMMAARLPAAPPSSLAFASFPAMPYATGGAATPAAPSDTLPQITVADNLPQSQVREEYRNSGAILSDARPRSSHGRP
jgi:spore germination cell wall hydrolase CwlJ-like protein